MDRLFHHIDAITRQRHRSELALRVVVALQELLPAQRVSIFKAFPLPDDLLVGLVAEADAHGGRSRDDGVSWPRDTATIDHFPDLRQCLAVGRLGLLTSVGAPRVTVDLRHSQGELFGFVDIELGAPATAAQLHLAEGLLAVMRNCTELLDYSETDTLTGLLNRKTFDQYLLNILSGIAGEADDGADNAQPQRRRAHPGASMHWLSVVDVDHFKQINDRFGHMIGDEVLILLANMMRSCFRSQDKLFRFGGEEFVVLLRPTEFEHAFAAFERFRHDVEMREFPQVGRVTVSVGFTAIGVRDAPSEVLGNADEALYWAKEHGRNRTCSYEQLRDAGSLQPHQLHTEVELFG